jgi:hypothetical protein
MVLRVRKEDSAYLYQILESYEGLTNFSTLDSSGNPAYRDIELHLAPDLLPEVLRLVEHLKREIPLETV